MEHAIAAREEITPHLLSALEETRNRCHELAVESGYMAHLYATYLLAQFREQRAYPLMVDLFSLPIDVLDRLVGDVITEDLGRLLAAVCGRLPGARRAARRVYENAQSPRGRPAGL